MEASEGVPPRPEVGLDELDVLDESLERMNEFVQCICWALRSVYATESPWITAYSKLKESLQQEACAFKQGLLPLTLTVVSRLATFFYDEYLDIELNVWRRRLDKVVDGAVEQEKLFNCLSQYYRFLAADVKSRAGAAQEVLDTVLFEARQFVKSRKLVHLTCTVREEVWIPLLFVPYVGCFATPFAVKNQDSSMSKRIAAKSEGESAVAAAYAQTDVLVPALEKTAESLDAISAFFHQLLPPLELLSVAKNTEDPAFLTKTERQLTLIKERAFRFRMKCLDLVGLNSSLEFTLDPIPNLSNEVVDDYVKDWLGEKKAPSEIQLTVRIIMAQGLPSLEADEGEGFLSLHGSDPYCVCMVPSKKRSSIKTRVIRDNTNPVWNFEGKVPDYIPGDSLEFNVFDKDYGRPDELLASIELAGDKFYPDGFSGDLQLTPHIRKHAKATLTIKIIVQDVKVVGNEEAVGVLLADKMRDATENNEIVWALEPY